MKRKSLLFTVIAIITVVVMVFTLAACSENSGVEEEIPDTEKTVTEETTNTEETSDAEETTSAETADTEENGGSEETPENEVAPSAGEETKGEDENGEEDENEVIYVSTEADLKKISENTDGNYVLTADIELTEAWTTIPLFNGTIDGNGHKITGLTITLVTEGSLSLEEDCVEGRVGFIGELTAAGTIKNLTVEYAVTPSEENVTALYSAATTLRNEDAAVETVDLFVGFVGVNKGTLENVTILGSEIDADLSLLSDEDFAVRIKGAGLLAGKNKGTVTESTVSDSEISIKTNNGYIRAGGAVGFMNGGGTVEEVTVEGTRVTAATTAAKIYAGGLIGDVEAGKVKDNVVTEVDVTAVTGGNKKSKIGGLIGMIDDTDYKTDLGTDYTVKVTGNEVENTVVKENAGTKTSAGGLIGGTDFVAGENASLIITGNTVRDATETGNKTSGLIADPDIVAITDATTDPVTTSNVKLTNNEVTSDYVTISGNE